MASSLILLTLVFGFIMSSWAQSERTCDLQSFQALCAQIPASRDLFISLPDGGRIRNPRFVSADTGATSAALAAQGRSRLEEKFAWVKQKMIEDLLAGRSRQMLTPDQKMFVSRIESLKLLIKDEGCSASPSGRYSAPTHEVQVCPEMGLQSDAQVTWLLAHEMGHAIDGCNCQHGRAARHRPLTAGPGRRISASNQMVLDEINRGSSFLLDPRDVSADLMRIVERAKATGGVTVLDQGMDPSRHPLNPILSCLVRKNILAHGLDVPPRGAGCREKGSFSETPSDLWGARIAGLALKERPPTTDLGRLGSLSQESIDLMCAPRSGAKAPPALMSSTWDQRLPTEGRYIDSRFRDEATFLTDPNVQAALGCKPSPRMGSCMAAFPQAMRDWGSSGAAGSATAPSAPAAPGAR